jgi:hypothetical protein
MTLIVGSTENAHVKEKFDGIYFIKDFYPKHNWERIEDMKYVDQTKTEDQFFLGSERKVYVLVQPQFYHLFLDTLSSIILEYKRDSSTLFILNMSSRPQIDLEFFNRPYVKFFFKVMDDYGINYVILDRQNTNDIYIKDFFYTDGALFSKEIIDNVRDFLSIYSDTNIVPEKKVYLSRRKAPIRKYKSLKIGLEFEHDERMLNEKLVEDYFEKHGFDIIFPEDFENFEDQIKYFNSVKLVVSNTSAGLVNSIFMQPGTLMMELLVPLTVEISTEGKAFEQVHIFYPQISYACGLNYIAVPHHRNPLKLIKKLESNKFLQVVINE